MAFRPWERASSQAAADTWKQTTAREQKPPFSRRLGLFPRTTQAAPVDKTDDPHWARDDLPMDTDAVDPPVLVAASPRAHGCELIAAVSDGEHGDVDDFIHPPSEAQASAIRTRDGVVGKLRVALGSSSTPTPPSTGRRKRRKSTTLAERALGRTVSQRLQQVDRDARAVRAALRVDGSSSSPCFEDLQRLAAPHNTGLLRVRLDSVAESYGVVTATGNVVAACNGDWGLPTDSTVVIMARSHRTQDLASVGRNRHLVVVAPFDVLHGAFGGATTTGNNALEGAPLLIAEVVVAVPEADDREAIGVAAAPVLPPCTPAPQSKPVSPGTELATTNCFRQRLLEWDTAKTEVPSAPRGGYASTARAAMPPPPPPPMWSKAAGTPCKASPALAGGESGTEGATPDGEGMGSATVVGASSGDDNARVLVGASPQLPDVLTPVPWKQLS